jgi:hypothetical protein
MSCSTCGVLMVQTAVVISASTVGARVDAPRTMNDTHYFQLVTALLRNICRLGRMVERNRWKGA